MKIIIIGKGNGWDSAPQDGETWGVHSLCLRRPVKMVFDMHKIDDPDYWSKRTEEDNKEQDKIIEYCVDNNIPLVTLKEIENIPSSVKFPIEEMPIKYSECSIAYMIFYAVYKGATEIDMYGVLMATDEEYNIQRKSVEYWIGYARGKGIEVNIHEPTYLCKAQGLYGYDYV
jgi:hypothetical protein